MRRRSSFAVQLAVPFFALLLASPGLAQRVRVGAPPTPAPEVIVTAVDCNAYVAFPPKRQRCLHCVSTGHRFFRQGDGGAGFCEGMAPPPPPPPPPPPVQEYLTAPGQCAALVVNPQKRGRCFDCVRRGGTFHRQGEHGFGACNLPPPPPPPPPPVVEALTTPGLCATHVHNPHKRQRCFECVGRGGTFYKQGDAGFGSCSMPPPPPPPPVINALNTPELCMNHLALRHKRHDCMDCVRRGGTYLRHGNGGHGACSLPPPPPPPPVIELHTVGQCFSQIAHPGTRHHCRKCVTHGGHWDMRGICRR